MSSYRPSIRLFVLIAIVTIGLAIASYIYYTYIPHCPSPPCHLKMSMLGGAIITYNKIYGEIPAPNKWCDLIMEYIVDEERLFLCPESDAIKGESSYAMNKNLAGMKIENIPNDVVVLFETDLGKNTWKCPRRTRASYKESEHSKEYGDEKVWKYRWNQSGGPEIITTSRHTRYKGHSSFCCYVNHNSRDHLSVRCVPREDANNLKWEIEGKE